MPYERWIETTDVLQITDPDTGDVVRTIPRIPGLTDDELAMPIIAHAEPLKGCDWWHLLIAENQGTDDWSDIHARIAAATELKRGRDELPKVATIARTIRKTNDKGKQTARQVVLSVRDIANEHGYAGMTRATARARSPEVRS
jgi:hypothetical protein